MMAASPRLAAMDPAQLHQAQTVWFAQQQADMEAYFTRIGRAEGRSFDPAWPIRT